VKAKEAKVALENWALLEHGKCTAHTAISMPEEKTRGPIGQGDPETWL